jgi:hypothetical protein
VPPRHRLTPAETAGALGLLLAGLIAGGWMRVYDAGTWAVAVVLTVINAAVSFGMFWAVGKVSGVAPANRLPAALWAMLPWNTFHLSQIAYVGFYFMPLEILASGMLLRIRARGPGFWTCLLAAAAVRMAALLVTYALRPVVRGLLAP